MKIRRKDDHDIVVAVDQPAKGICLWVDSEKRWYAQGDWELVPEKEWVDVTGECLIATDHDGFSRLMARPLLAYVFLQKGFEWRKVEAYVIPDDWVNEWIVSDVDQYKTTVLQIMKKEG